MDINYMKQFIISRYPSSLTWRDRVNNMKDNQVISIYYSMLKREQEPKKEKKKIKLQSSEKYHQISIAEYLTMEENKVKEQPVETEQYHQITIGEYLASLKTRDTVTQNV